MISLEQGFDMHTHFSFIMGLEIFTVVLVVGTAWRLVASRLIANRHDFWTPVGEAMLFQF